MLKPPLFLYTNVSHLTLYGIVAKRAMFSSHFAAYTIISLFLYVVLILQLCTNWIYHLNSVSCLCEVNAENERVAYICLYVLGSTLIPTYVPISLELLIFSV